MRIKCLIPCLLFAITTFIQPVFAEVNHGMAVKVSTLGAGVEYQRQVLAKGNLRLGLNGWSRGDDGTEGGISYDIDLNLFNISALMDWHPFDGIFRLSGGFLYNGNELELKGNLTTAGTVTVGNTAYTIGAGDTLSGEVDFNAIAPYIGLGWGNALREGKTWGFLFDVGVLFQGSPDASLTATGSLLTQAGFTADIAREINDLESSLDSFDVYPVVSLALSYKF